METQDIPTPRNAPRNAPRPTPCAGAVCLRAPNQVLIIQRGQPPNQGDWTLPGGRIEPGETAAATALRELHEETGVSAELLGLVEVVDAIIRDPAGTLTHHYVIVDYAVRWTGGEPRADDDAAAAQFLPIDQALAKIASPQARDVVQAAMGQFGTMLVQE